MEQTIIAYYEAILRQTPTQSQIDQWDAFLTEADDLEDALADFAQALCLQADEVRSILRLYQAVFDRMSDSGGLTFWTNRFRDIQEANPELSYRDALIETISQWLESDEYIARFGDDLSDEDFLSLVYLNILGRPADQEGYNFWLAVLKSGAMSREQLIVEFTESDEFKADVDDEANGLLKAAAAIDSDTAVDDLPYEFPGGDPYTGELGNEAPVDILIGTDIDEDAEDGDEVNEGQLTVVDPDGGETFTWELIDPTGTFGLDDPNAQQPKIIVVDASGLDHETDDVMTVTIRVTDSDGNTYEEDVDIDINDINEGPFNLDLSNLTIAEQDGSLSNPGLSGLVVGVLTSDDVDDGDTATYTLLSQSVANAFEIDGDELKVLDPSVIDSEAGVTSIDVEVQVEDSGGLTQVKTFTIDVTSLIDEDPTNVLPETLNVAATTPAGLTLADLLAEDPESDPDSHTFSITGDPTGGAFGIDITGKKLVLADPTLINSTNLVDGGPVDEDGVVNGLVEVTLNILIEDSNGNTYADTIVVTVDQNGLIIPFTDTVVEVLDGSNGDDVFTANAGYGPNAPVPGFNQTANGGDIANGMGGDDLFVLTKQDNNYQDFARPVTGVTLNDIEGVLIINRDQSPVPPAPTLDLLSEVCTPCINMPVMASGLDDPVIFEASLSPDIDQVAFGQSLASVGIWDLQADFWTLDAADANDLGPVVDIFDVTANFVWVDSDPQAKLDGAPIDELVFTVDEVLINELRITENASGNEPGGPRSEQVGTIRIVASGVPSVLGSINNGFPGGPLLPGWPGAFPPSAQPTTHTLNIEVTDLTGSSPTSAVGPAAAAANTAAIDFFAGQVDGIGNPGLSGLENVNITGGGDVFLVFDETANDVDSDVPTDGRPLEIVDGAGSGFFFFEEGGFKGVWIDGGDGYDTVGVYSSDLTSGGSSNIVSNVERLKVLDSASGQLSLHPFTDDLQKIVLSAGVSGDLTIINMPDLSQEGATTDQSLLCDDFGVEGFVVEIDQCCYEAPGNPPVQLGDFPLDFDLFLDADGGNTARIATIFNVDPGGLGGAVTVDSLRLRDINTYHLNVTDCDNSTDGLFEVRYFTAIDPWLRTLLLTSNSGTNGGNDTTKILQDTASQPGGFVSTENLTLIKGTGDSRNQEFLEFDGPQAADLKFLPVLEDWGDDIGTTRPGGLLGIASNPDNIDHELVVSIDGAVADLGEGNDIYTGNRFAGGGDNDLGADFIRGNGGNDLLFGAGGNDQIEGGTGDDEIQGEGGDDCLFGDEGDDLILAGSGNDYVDGGADDDVIFGGDDNDNLRGGSGDDAICGDDGDDCLHGEAGDDLLIGGQGDDFLDAGADGTDMLVGDYGCEPCYAHVTIPDTDLEECDIFSISIDTDGDGVVDMTFTTEVGPGNALGGGDVLADEVSIAADLAARIQDWIDNSAADPECWDVSREFGIVTICKVGDELVVEGSGVDAAIPSVHKSRLDGQIGEGDQFTFDITWDDGGPQNQTYTFNYDPADLGGDVSADGIVDTVLELKALAELIAGDFNAGAAIVPANVDPSNNGTAAALFTAGFTMEVDANGDICLKGPDDKTGQTPTVAISAADGAFDEILATFGQECIDIDEGQTFQAGDVVSVGVDISGDGLANFLQSITVADVDGIAGIDARDVAMQLRNELNTGASAAIVTATLDPNDATKVIVTADNAGVGGDFDLIGPNAAEAARVVARTNDLTAEFDAGDTSLRITIGDDDSPNTSYSQVWNTDLATSLADFVTSHAADILTNHGLVVRVNTGGDRLEFVDPDQNTADSGLTFSADINGTGVALVETVDTAEVLDPQVCAWDIVINAGETLDVVVDGILYSVPFNTDTNTTISDFAFTHSAALGPHLIPSNGGGDVLVFTDFVPTLGPRVIDSVMVNGGNGGSASVNNAVTSKTLFDPGDVIEVVVAEDSEDDDTQSHDFVSQTPGTPPQPFDLDVVIDDKTEPDQDVFVVSARANDMAAFANDGYDNDHRPNEDFHGLLAAAGLGTGDGAGDSGVDGVVYVMDFNQGGGGDDLSTYHINEAYSKADNTTVDGRFYDDLQDAFGLDAERYQGDKLAFRKSDGELDDCGTTFNYQEEQDQAVDRDDSDANAVNAFNANDDLRYFVSARSFEDALLDNHGLIWGVDVDQAIVDDAIADLADDGMANNSAGGIADGVWGNATQLLNIMNAADGESWLRVYYNEAGTDAAPEAVMELVGLDDVSQLTFKDIVGADCIEDCNEIKTPEDVWLTL